MSSRSQTVENLLRERQGVLNLPTSDLVSAVDQLALTTGHNPVPEAKEKIGYRYQADKFARAGLTPIPADLTNAPLVAECPIQLEAVVEQVHAFDEQNGTIKAIEMRIVRVHIDEQLLVPGTSNYIDPEKWNPLIVSTPRWKAEGLFLASTAVLHTFAGVQLWLLLPKHPSPMALGQRTNAPWSPNPVGRPAFLRRYFAHQRGQHEVYNGT